MKRRDSIKGIVLGSITATAVLQSCKYESKTEAKQGQEKPGLYGRSIEELERDQKIMATPSSFSEKEMEAIGILMDTILPAEGDHPSARDAGGLEFVDFISKDIEEHQMPIKSGIAWLNRKSHDLFGNEFNSLSNTDRIKLIELIAYPFDVMAENKVGAKFFSKIRDLTLTSYYTSKPGLRDLGYMGNIPNFWDGVPADVLRDHGFEYEEKYLRQYVDEKSRNEVAKWDSNGNLI